MNLILFDNTELCFIQNKHSWSLCFSEIIFKLIVGILYFLERMERLVFKTNSDFREIFIGSN